MRKIINNQLPKLMALAAILFVFPISPASIEAQELRWNLDKDDALTVEIGQVTVLESRVDQRTRKINNELTVTFDWMVEGSTAEAITIRQKMIGVKVEVLDETSLGEKVVSTKLIKLNTDEKVNLSGVAATLMKQIQPLLGSEFLVEMSPRGEILKVTIPDETLEVIRTAPASLQIRSLLTEDGLESLFGQAAIVMPKEDPKVGGTWETSELQETPMGKFNRVHNYTYAGEKDVDGKKMDQFDLVTELNPTEKKEKKEDVKQPMSQDDVPPELVEFEGKGTIFLDREAGFFKSSAMKNRLQSKRQYRDMVINTTVTTDVTMKIEKK